MTASDRQVRAPCAPVSGTGPRVWGTQKMRARHRTRAINARRERSSNGRPAADREEARMLSCT